MRAFLSCCVLVLTAHAAFAQPVSAPLAGSAKSDWREIVNNRDYHFVGNVEMELDDTTLFADEVWYYSEEKRAVAAGNVTYIQGSNRISADRAEMNIDSRLGTFFHAWGLASIQPQRQTAPVGGFVAPQLTGHDSDVYFFGERIEKIGAKKYKITNGGFTTCVQPSPRWDLHADTVVLNIDHYTLLRNVIFNVKNVPLFYLPVVYYPTKEEGRATGFLLPTYGSTTLRGQQISNAFFWAINRSQDATIKYDWFSKGAQGWNSEYRYATLTGDGTLEGHLLDQRNNQLGLPSRSLNLRGGVNQALPGAFRARARVDYFSSLATNQTLHSSFFDTSNNRRSYGGNVAGAWRGYSINATFDRTEHFSGATSSVLTGNAPRLSVTRGERPLYRNSPAYFSVGTEFVQFEREGRSGDLVTDTGLARLDLNPQIRYPFKRWQWFTVNSTVLWRNTFYTRSKIPGTDLAPERIVGNNLNRQYVTLTAHTVGPVFNRVWNTPSNGYAERFKHTIEPFFTLQRTTSINNSDRIIRTDGADWVVGDATSVTYGLNNRIYAKRRVGPASQAQASQAQEIVNVELKQAYYSDERSSLADQQFITTYNAAAPTRFSPVSLAVRAAPAASLNATFRAEFDARHRALRTTSLSSSYNWTTRLQTSVGWTRKYLIKELPGFNDPNFLDHYINLDTRLSTIDNRFGGSYSMNVDVQKSAMRQQRINGYYNAQCCGIAFEYQTFSFGSRLSVPRDRRFFVSFSLAGLGNFSPFSGALANVPR